MPFLHACKQSLVAGEYIRIRDRLLKFLDSSRDKEHDDAQFLQIGVSMAKLQSLLNYCKFFMKYVFLYQDFIMHCAADFCMRHYAGFSQIGSHIINS